jgi:tetratricopeptide (TPR) repeat protein
LHEAQGDALERAGLFNEALAQYASALQRSSDLVRKADLMFKRARLKAYSGNFPAGLAELSKAATRLDDTPGKSAQGARARIHSFRAVIRMMQGRADVALRLAEMARSEAEQTREQEALARAYMVLDAASESLGHSERSDYLQRALTIYEDMGDRLGAALVYNNMGASAWFEGRLDDAIALYSKAAEISTQSGNDPDAALARTNVGEVLIAQGKFEEANSELQDATRVLRAHGSQYAALAELQLARVSLEMGDIDEAIDSLQRVRDEASAMGQTEWALIAIISLASAHRRLGDVDAAMRLLDEAESELSRGGELYRPLLALERAHAFRDAGDEAAAAASASEGRDIAAGLGLRREEAELDEFLAAIPELVARP